MKSTFIVGVVLFASLAFAQDPTFDVASIKVNNSGSVNSGLAPLGNRLTARNVTLRTLVLFTYSQPQSRLSDTQILGLPDWANTIRYDIVAKSSDASTPVSSSQFKVMMQSLLQERFQLKIHRGMRDLPVYDLVVAKSGLKSSVNQTPLDPGAAIIRVTSQEQQLSELPRGGLTMFSGSTAIRLSGTGVPISSLIAMLQPYSDRIIIDKTGVTQLIDVSITFARDDLAGSSTSTSAGTMPVDVTVPDPLGRTLFSAVQQIGLKLQPSKAPLPVVLVDTVKPPSEN